MSTEAYVCQSCLHGLPKPACRRLLALLEITVSKNSPFVWLPACWNVEFCAWHCHIAKTAGHPPIAVRWRARLLLAATDLATCTVQVELGKRKEPEPMLPPPPKPAGAAMPPPGRPAPASMPPPPVQPPSSALPPPVSAPTQLPPPPRPALVSCNSSTCMQRWL